jgi:hypothetical protein
VLKCVLEDVFRSFRSILELVGQDFVEQRKVAIFIASFAKGST